MVRVGKKVWKGEEELKLSKLLLTFWQRHGCLPSGRVSGFWQTVKARLAQRFTIKQIQRKVPTLRKRHLSIINGTAREVKTHEAETVPLWTKMIYYAEEEEEEDVAIAEHVHLHGTEAREYIKEEDNQEGQADSNNMAILNEHATIYAGMEGEDLARAAGAEEDGSSCCIIEEENDPEEVEEVEEAEEGQNMEEAEEGQIREEAERHQHDQERNEEVEVEVEEEEEEEEEAEEDGWDAAAQDEPAHTNHHPFHGGAEEEVVEEEEAWDAAAQHEPAHNNHHAFHQEAASMPCTDKQEQLKMLNCLAIADLASAVKTLAEVVRVRRPPIPV